MFVFIAIAVLAFGVLIFVHELGHFLAAKAGGVRVLEFALGMGPILLKKQGRKRCIHCGFCPSAVSAPWRARMPPPTTRGLSRTSLCRNAWSFWRRARS
jgi:hypothetical protein